MPIRIRGWFFVLAMLLSFAWGCGSSNGAKKKPAKGTLRPGADAQAAYEEALLDFRRGDCLVSEPQFREIRREFPYSRFAALSELRIADCLYKDESYPEAIQMYRQFVRARPSHREIPYARFRIAESYYKQVPSGWFMTPPSSQRDQTAARDALIQLRRFVVDYPEDDRELYVARFYLRRDAYRGVVARIKGLLASYPGSGVEPEALLLLGEVYLETEDTENARQALDELVERFPESDEASEARSLLRKLSPS